MVYLNSLPNGFHYDDTSTILQNPAVQSIERLPEHFWSVNIGKQEGGVSYRPLVMVSYGLNYWWGGANPVGYHVVNIALHIVASVLVVLLGWNLSGQAAAAMLGGLVFALHPIQTEAVNYITARSSILYSVGVLATVVAFIRFRANPIRAILAVALVAYLCALLAKETAVIVPLLLLGYDVVVRRLEWSHIRRWVKPHLPFAALTVAYLVLRRAMMGSVMPVDFQTDPLVAALTFFGVVAKTLSGQLLPVDLSASQPFGLMRRLTVQGLWAIAVFAGFIIVWAGARRRAPLVAYAAVWFLVALLPLLPLSLSTPLALYQENRGYLSAAALAMVAGPALAWPWEARVGGERWIMIRRSALVGVFATMAIAVAARNPVWRNDVTLWRDVLQKAPGNRAAYVNLGAAYQARGELHEAAEIYRQALGRFPDNAFLHNNLGAIYLTMGEWGGAGEEFREAIRLAPRFATPYFNLGLVLQRADAPAEAAASYRRFLELAPGQPGTAADVVKARQRLADLEGREGAGSIAPN